MFPWIRASLKTVFHSGRQLHVWRRHKLRGDRNDPNGILCCSGLTANGAFHLRPVSVGLHEHSERKWDVWHRNLYGHTGVYQDFRKSRMWQWIADACGTLARLLERHSDKKVVLVGFSTGALVLLVTAFLFELLKFGNVPPHARQLLARLGIFGRNVTRLDKAIKRGGELSKLILVVPAFRLKRRPDELLLSICFVMYYLLIPLCTFLALIAFTSRWPLVLLVHWLDWQVFSRIWIPSGDAIAANETGDEKVKTDSLLLVVMSCFYCGLTPFFLLLLGGWGRTVFVTGEVLFLLTLLPPLMWRPARRAANGIKENHDSHGYLWLPVVATSTLMPLQWIARYVAPRLRTETIVILATADNVVDNLETRKILPHAKMLEQLGVGHGDWNPTHQTGVLATLISILGPR